MYPTSKKHLRVSMAVYTEAEEEKGEAMCFVKGLVRDTAELLLEEF